MDKAGANAEALDLRGSIYLEQKNFDGAADAFRAANAANENLFLPQLHSGDLFFRQQKFREAREAYEKALRNTTRPTMTERLRFAMFMTYLGEHDEAGTRTALNAIPFPTQTASYYYAHAALAFSHSDKAGAEQWLRAAGKIFDVNQTAWFARALYDFGWLKTKPPLTSE